MAIGGNADEPVPTTEPPYSRSDGAGAHPNLTRRDIDRLIGGATIIASPFAVVSLGPYRGDLRRAIHSMKFRNRRWIAARFGRHLADAVERHFDGWRPDLVTWAPTTTTRSRLRGHDQSALVAASLARVLNVRCLRTLRRTDDRTQTGASRTARQLGPRYMVRSSALRNKRVLLVDDVMTTGTTLVHARNALLAARAAEVRCVVIAHVNTSGRTGVG